MYNLVNINLTNDRLGRSNSSISINSGSALIPSLAFYQTGYTFCMWIKLKIAAGGCLRILVANGLIFSTSAYPLQNTPYVYFGHNNYNLISKRVLSLNQWQHLAFTFDGQSTIAIYIDGNQVANNTNFTITKNVISSSNTLSGSSYYFELDELKIFRKGLNTSEILKETMQIYQNLIFNL